MLIKNFERSAWSHQPAQNATCVTSPHRISPHILPPFRLPPFSHISVHPPSFCIASHISWYHSVYVHNMFIAYQSRIHECFPICHRVCRPTQRRSHQTTTNNKHNKQKSKNNKNNKNNKIPDKNIHKHKTRKNIKSKGNTNKHKIKQIKHQK